VSSLEKTLDKIAGIKKMMEKPQLDDAVSTERLKAREYYVSRNHLKSRN